MTKQQIAKREAKKRADFEALNYHMIGSKHKNTGTNLTVGAEWDMGEFRVRQVEVTPNPVEPGHFNGVVEVIGFSK